jgi:hypothetical protein
MSITIQSQMAMYQAQKRDKDVDSGSSRSRLSASSAPAKAAPAVESSKKSNDAVKVSLGFMEKSRQLNHTLYTPQAGLTTSQVAERAEAATAQALMREG